MTMLHSFHENLDIQETDKQFEITPAKNKKKAVVDSEVHLFSEKLRVPKFNDLIPRERLERLLLKSSRQFGATLLLGRSGTGKTAVAAKFAEKYEKIAWYSVGSADDTWNVFSKYLVASFNESNLSWDLIHKNSSSKFTSDEGIPYFVESLLLRLSLIDKNKPRLIVIDNAHYVFDSEWFNTFFPALVYSLSPKVHFLILSRCKPGLPLWRLRSKQVLGVIDEKLLSFNYEETQKLLKKYPLSQNIIENAYSESFGRISKLKEIAESLK